MKCSDGSGVGPESTCLHLPLRHSGRRGTILVCGWHMPFRADDHTRLVCNFGTLTVSARGSTVSQTSQSRSMPCRPCRHASTKHIRMPESCDHGCLAVAVFADEPEERQMSHCFTPGVSRNHCRSRRDCARIAHTHTHICPSANDRKKRTPTMHHGAKGAKAR